MNPPTDNHSWELVLRDGRTIEIPPNAVEVVKRRRDAKQAINLTNESINYGDIASFRKTGKVWGQQLLEEEAAQAFHEPLYNDDGAVAVRWVKKEVSPHEYQTRYSKQPQYRMLEQENGLVMIAFRLPIHLIDTSKVTYCSEVEEKQLTQY